MVNDLEDGEVHQGHKTPSDSPQVEPQLALAEVLTGGLQSLLRKLHQQMEHAVNIRVNQVYRCLWQHRYVEQFVDQFIWNQTYYFISYVYWNVLSCLCWCSKLSYVMAFWPCNNTYRRTYETELIHFLSTIIPYAQWPSDITVCPSHLPLWLLSFPCPASPYPSVWSFIFPSYVCYPVVVAFSMTLSPSLHIICLNHRSVISEYRPCCSAIYMWYSSGNI